MRPDSQLILDNMEKMRSQTPFQRLRDYCPAAAEIEYDAQGNPKEYFTAKQWASLSEEQKQHIWKRIFNENYPLYELLRDPNIKMMKKMFGATPAIEKRWLSECPA